MTIGGFEIEKKISLGSILTIIITIVTVSAAWQALATGTASNAANLEAVRVVNSQQDDALRTLLATINSDRLEQQKLLTEMRTDIRYLRRDVETKRRLEEDATE